MKKHKYKAYSYRTKRSTLSKIIVQHNRGGDYEVTFISYNLRVPPKVRARHRLSGFFAIAQTKHEALLRLHTSLIKHIISPSMREEIDVIPWAELLKKETNAD